MDNIKIRKKVRIDKKDALIIVDMQNDFIPDGALQVEGGDLIIEGINKIANKFKKICGNVILTQDWHPPGHKSFASVYPGKNPGDEYRSEDGAIGPVLWPDHCVQGTEGSAFHKNLNTDLARGIIRKGTNINVDSYSVFLENDKKTETGLAGYLKSLNINRIYICGLALDYCCYFSAMDAVDFDFEVFFIVDLTKGIDIPPGNISKSLGNMKKKKVQFVSYQDSFK